MPAPKPTPKPSRKDQIEAIAAALFKERGYAATSMRDLASEVGIEAATIYSHVRSKEEILQSICFKMAHEFFEELERIQSGEVSTTQQIRRLIDTHLRIITRNLAASVVFLHDWRHLSEPYLTHFLELREQYEQKIRETIQAGMLSGEFVALDARFVTRTLLSSLNGVTQWYQMDGALKPEDIAVNLSNLFLHGLTVHETRPRYH